MAQGSKSKEEIVRESMNSSKIIDDSVTCNIVRSPRQFDPKIHTCKCSACGKGFTTKKNNFQKSNSSLFQSNDGYLPWCKECSDKYFIFLTGLYSGNQEHAIEHFCQQADWVYDENPLIAARDSESGHRDRTRISHYSAKKNLNTDGRKTYIDTLKFNFKSKQNEVITSKEDIRSDDISVKASAIDRWGVGFTELDYKNLDEHYKMLKKYNPNVDNNQEIFIKDLCNINMLKIRSLQNGGDTKEYSPLVEQYAKTFKQAGLRTIAEKDSSNDETFSMTLGFFSEFTPEEFYLNKPLYRDMDNFGEYLERHVTRPMINLETGSETRDFEYFVPNEEDDYDE